MDDRTIRAALPQKKTGGKTNGSQPSPPIEHPGADRQAMAAEKRCPVCRGAQKVLRPANPGEKPNYGGESGIDRVVLMDCPVCNRDGQQRYLERLSRLTAEMRTWGYGNTQDTDDNGAAYDYGKTLAERPRWFYTLWGAFGVGKTRLLACLVNAGRTNGWTSIYITMAELLDHLRAAFNPQTAEKVTFDALWEDLCKCRILAIDEADRFNPTPWAVEKFTELIESRYRNGPDRCTAFATNVDPATLNGYLYSRMMYRESRVFHITGGDWRL